MVVPTNIRPGRSTRLLAAFQTAKGTPAADFTIANATELWTDSADIDAQRIHAGRAWMDSDLGPAVGARASRGQRPAGRLEVKGTAESLEWLLRSNFGPLSAGSFSLNTQIADATQWLTLGWIEDRFDGTSSTDRLVRIQDAWVHRLTMVAINPQSPLMLDAEYAGRQVLIQALNAGGITLPATPMTPGDQDPFPSSGATLVRDPLGTPVTIDFRDLRIMLDQGLAHEWDMNELLYNVWKTGKLRAELEFSADWADETWTILDRMRAGTDDLYRFSVAVGGLTLTMDFHNLLLETAEVAGHDGQTYKEFRGRGLARNDGTDFIDISLS